MAYCINNHCIFYNIRLVDISSGQLLKEYVGHKHNSFKLEAAMESGDSRVVTVDEDGSIVHWPILATDGKPLYQTTGAHFKVQLIVLSYNTYISSNFIVLHIISTGLLIQAGSSVSCHPSNNLFLTASYDGTAKLWESKSSEP